MSEDSPSYPAWFRPGSLVAGYRLQAHIGTGGMAVVFRALDVRLDRLVALKILDPARASDPEFRQRFIAESRAAAMVDDPNIIPVHDSGEADGVLFIAMRFVHGGDLRRVLEREGTLSAERAAEFISPVASALDAAHAAGLVHRDVKPANILVDTGEGRPDHVYLSDFGIAKPVVSTVSLTGSFIGTLDYAAPEQIDGLALDGRADQYALAGVAYRLLTGTVPFERDQAMAVMAAHLYAPPPSLVARRPDLPGAVDKVLAKAMAKAPDQRYESCGAFAEALRKALGLAPYRASRPASAPVYPAARRNSGVGTPAAAPLRTVSVRPRRPARPRRSARRRGQARPFWAGVSAAIIVIVGATLGVLAKMHADKPSEAIAERGNQRIIVPGYQGERGTVTVNSIASDGGTQLAVGSADGQAAIWQRGPAGAWSMVWGESPVTENLTGVAHGPAGWIAVGDVVSGAVQQPFLMTSADGETWQLLGTPAAFAGQGSYVTGVSAGPDGYAVVGKQVGRYGRLVAAMWWSANLRSWAQGSNDSLDGRQQPSTVSAVAATSAGFVAVGTHGNALESWTSAGGRNWTKQGMTVPRGAASAVLTQLTVNGTRVVAAGYAVTTTGDIPIVAVSADGGLQWSPVPVRAPGGLGAVTALSAAGNGFAAAGTAGPAGAQHPVIWRSADGLRWSAATQVGGGAQQISALYVAGGAMDGIARKGGVAYVIPLAVP